MYDTPGPPCPYMRRPFPSSRERRRAWAHSSMMKDVTLAPRPYRPRRTRATLCAAMSISPTPSAGDGSRVPSLDEALGHDLDVLRRAGLLRALPSIRRRDGARITVDGQDLVDFASNDYLGLAAHARLAHAIVHALPATGV